MQFSTLAAGKKEEVLLLSNLIGSRTNMMTLLVHVFSTMVKPLLVAIHFDYDSLKFKNFIANSSNH